MRTLKLFVLVAIMCLAGRQSMAQCFYLDVYPLHTGYDSIVVYAVNLASAEDSAAATLIIDYGDGNIDTTSGLEPVVHGYAVNGTYTVCVSYSSPGCSSTMCDTIEAITCPPQPYYVVQSFIEPGKIRLQVPFTSGVHNTHNWNFGSNATPATSTDNYPIVTYTGSGLYPGSVTITESGCSQTVNFLVNMQSCAAVIEDTITDGMNVTLTASCDTSIKLEWMFDDGLLGATGKVANFDLYDYKTYNYYLVSTSAACRDTTFGTITVVPEPGNIYGHVYKGGEAACWGKVYLLQQSVPGTLIAIDSTDILNDFGCLGVYTMPVPAGTYYLKAVLTAEDIDNGLYLPTYYGDDTDEDSAVAITAASTANLIINLEPLEPGIGTGMNEVAIQSASVFPNPVSDVATIRVTAQQNSTGLIQLVDMKGSIIVNATANIASGVNNIQLNLSNQPAGVYHLCITTGSERQTVKIVKTAK